MTRRLLLSYVTLVAFVLLVLEIPLGVSFSRREVDDLTSSVERDAFVLATLVEDRLEHAAGVDITAEAQSYTDRTGGRVVVLDAAGVAVVDTDAPGSTGRSFASRPEFQQALGGSSARGTRYSDTLHTRIAYAAVPVASSGVVHGALRITYPTSTVDGRVRRMWLTLGAIAAVTVLAAVIVALSLARSVTAPLRRLGLVAAGLGAGDLTARAPTDAGPPEVRAVAVAFNQMATELQELVHAQQAFVADASHELRSPLAALRLRLENAARDASGDSQHSMAAAMDEVARLSRIVDGLLVLARAERDDLRLPTVPVDVRALLENRAAAWTPLAAERRVTIRTEPPGGGDELWALATPDRLAQVLDNLLANALEASTSESVITLRAERPPEAAGSGLVDVHVADQGPGLDEHQRHHAFDRFWRAERDRTRPGGSGLGLSIVRKLVTADGGAVELREAPGGGLDAVVRLRAASA